ncbi:MAG: 30S ribosomal protein S6 [Candidatus Yanofskybacteria bacterium RIFCSPLOWO2_01_FULL_49_25]|uniref:Small ribosomal subunit protein bS6 n=1 Tax=Candidatus Yanofskybacteria bacterium RIFCSPLOWO2_01_FULL_49_25 TaxID=1802701 RepID=A0A1F8GXK2_9BACT|nr:MAG: 30S ribosomal protein S6 [Candidatus Yanofskybacteria bacterium RIFCSPLOWO2_01_FULL_49_25]
MEGEIQADNRLYELAYHITPDLEEAAVKAKMSEVESVVTQNGGVVVLSRDPRRMHLSYPIAHKHYAFFGVLDFQGNPEGITAIDSQMKLHEGILRYMVLKKPEEGKEIRSLGDRLRKARSVAPTHQKTADEGRKVAKPAATPVEQEKMTKELEDVLGKI